MGAWTPQEVAYATRVADLYRAGSLPNVPDGITLRILLSKLLNCQPMRVSKKYSGESWSHHGKRPFRARRGDEGRPRRQCGRWRGVVSKVVRRVSEGVCHFLCAPRRVDVSSTCRTTGLYLNDFGGAATFGA